MGRLECYEVSTQTITFYIMEQLFNELPKIEPCFFQRLLKREPTGNGFVELNNLFANKDLKDISDSDVHSISSKYKIDLYNKFSNKLKDIYAKYLAHCLTDSKLADEELGELKKIKNLLKLTDRDI